CSCKRRAAARRPAWLCGAASAAGLVVFQDLVDGPTQAHSFGRRAGGFPGSSRVALRTKASSEASREPARTLTASRSLVLWTTERSPHPRIRAPLCTPLRCSTKHNFMGMFDGTSLPLPGFAQPEKRRLRGVYWSILHPRLPGAGQYEGWSERAAGGFHSALWLRPPVITAV